VLLFVRQEQHFNMVLSELADMSEDPGLNEVLQEARNQLRLVTDESC
jgi:hypothetical protein